jgi:D-aspartate ligase
MLHEKKNKNSKFPTGVVVLGCETQGLGILRALGVQKVPTIVVDQDRFGVARASRYCKLFKQSPPYKNYSEFIDFLINLCKKYNLKDWTLFPTDDEQVRALSEYKEDLSFYYKDWVPAWQSIETVYDKSKFYPFAKQLELDIPNTDLFHTYDELMQAELKYPLIIKPAVKGEFYKKFRRKAIEVHSRDELIEQMNLITPIVSIDKLMIQEIIPGHSSYQYSYVTFFKNTMPFADLIARRSRQHPMDYGKASTFVEKVDFPKIRETSVKLLRAINYYGVCEVEFKFDPRDNTLKLLEVNPRFWGWHSLTKSTGMNWPFLLFCDIYGYAYLNSANFDQRKEKWVKMTTDLPIVLNECLSNRLTIGKIINQYFSRRTEHVGFRWNDPLPFFYEWFLIPYLWIKRGF